MEKGLLYKISKENHNESDLLQILLSHPEIKFVSLMGVDLLGNTTDERIPIRVFKDDLKEFLTGAAVQTDGSSVYLPGIATLDDAKVDMVTDLDVDWFIHHNKEFIDKDTNLPVSTIIIPCFLYHNGVKVDSRSILEKSIKTFKSEIINLLGENPDYLNKYDLKIQDIADVLLTSATELEFWVKTPNEKAEIEALTTSQVLHEQYWARINGTVKNALEECLLEMEDYGFNPEMGHKEIGGIKPKLGSVRDYNHIMEQLEVDWKYSNTLQAADNQIFVKDLINDIFMSKELETTFMAKPIDNVAGNGMHIHLGVNLKLKNGKIVNIFNSLDGTFLSKIGYGALMGLLKNYEVMNPFISSTNDSLKRLKPGYEAPVCVVTSLGKDYKMPSRNRSVLIGLIKDLKNPFATRFELRSPNPCSNAYLAMATSYLAMIDGIKYALNSKKSEKDLLAEISKKQNEDAGYLEKSREYRSEDDVFESYTQEQRDSLFGYAPKTVFENIIGIEENPSKCNMLKLNDVFTDEIINSFRESVLSRWKTEITQRLISEYRQEVREYTRSLNLFPYQTDEDTQLWNLIENLKIEMFKDTKQNISLVSKIKNAFNEDNYKLASDLVIELEDKMIQIRDLYSKYEKNLV